MPPARVVAVAPGSPAAGAGLDAGDEVVSVNGDDLRDVISYQLHVDGPHVELEVRRGGLERSVVVEKADGAPLGIELESAVFDRVRTCDNHCPFCFIHQLPKGMRKSLYLEGRRLPAVVSLRKLHDAHALHRSRPRTRRHRAARPAVREHPRHRPRRADASAAQPSGRHQPALAGTACSTPGSRCTGRSSCAPASTTVRCSTTRCSACSTGSPRSRPSAWCRSE